MTRVKTTNINVRIYSLIQGSVEYLFGVFFKNLWNAGIVFRFTRPFPVERPKIAVLWYRF